MSNIYLRVRLESEYLTHVAESRGASFSVAPFLWSLHDAQPTLVRAPSKIQLTAAAGAVSEFLSSHAESLNLEQLQRICSFEAEVQSWTSNARVAYARVRDFLNFSIKIYYDFIHFTVRLKAFHYSLFLRHLFKELEVELLRILEEDFHGEVRVKVLSAMEKTIDLFGNLNRADSEDFRVVLDHLQDMQELFEVESLLNP